MSASVASETQRSGNPEARVRLTIGLPVYNGENFLARAIESILAQTYRDFELVISDNGSTDRTREICEHYAALDARVRYYGYEDNRGAGWNYENVRALARGTDFFKWASHDDLIAPTFVERTIAALDADPGAVLAFSGVAAIDANDEVTSLKRRQVEAVAPHSYERFGEVIGTNANPEAIFGVMRVSALAHTRGQGDYIASDRILLAELAVQGRFSEVPEILLYNRDHPARSVRVTGGNLHQLTAWFAPAKSEQFAPYFRLWSEYAAAAWHAPLPLRERILCLARLPLFLRGAGRMLARDVAHLARRILRPWRRPSGETAPVGGAHR